MNDHRCRLCLKHSSSCIEIFEDNFSEMIYLLTGLKLQHNDGLPTTSCIQCYQDVKSAITIRSQIINSYQNLLKELKYNVESVLYPIHSDVNNEEYRDQEECSNEDNSSNISEIGESIQVKSEKTLDLLRVKNRKAKFRSTGRSLTQENGKEIKKQRLSNSYSLKVHCPIKAEHQEFVKSLGKKDRVPCPECGRVMFGMNMKNHLITHNYDPVICDICGKSSKNAQALQDHINYYHKTTPDRFMCDKCGKGYRVRFMLERHEKKEHGNGDRDYECSICGKKFFEKLHLKNHINITHKKIKAYKCEHCGKDFGRRTQFVTHQLVHTKENRYHCQVCGKGFKIKQSMQTHLKGVHGIEEEKTIFCKICQKGFATPQGLRAHVNSRVHGLEKCDLCNEYITVEYKNVHLSDIHGIELKEA
ncbi:hypothetical protein ABEB36_004324 [Hypothenemus hampei]|uniref:Uncharacterized protein n=1 Tax=Hypothenemus hampei TaxID=57062 RepID=A0ABD1F2X8_HYPHA